VETEDARQPVCPRPALVERGWRPLPNDCTPDELEYSKEYPGAQGRAYHVFAQDRGGELRLRLAYAMETGAVEMVSAALRPDQLPGDIRAAAEADMAAAGGHRAVP